MNRETAVGLDHTQRITEVNALLESEKKRFSDLDAKWKQEKQLVDKILDIRHKLRSAAEPIEDAPPSAEKQPAAEKANTKPATATKAKSAPAGTDKAPAEKLTIEQARCHAFGFACITERAFHITG